MLKRVPVFYRSAFYKQHIISYSFVLFGAGLNSLWLTYVDDTIKITVSLASEITVPLFMPQRTHNQIISSRDLQCFHSS